MFHTKARHFWSQIALKFNPQPPHISKNITGDLFQCTKYSQICIHCILRLWLASGSLPSNANQISGIERQLKRKIPPLRPKNDKDTTSNELRCNDERMYTVM